MVFRVRLIGLATVLAAGSMAQATVIHVPGDSATIQSAVNAAGSGDTVLVAPGTYHEGLLIDGTNLTLASWYLTTGDSAYIDSTALDGDSARTILLIRGGVDTSTLVTGFTFQHGNSSSAGGGIDCRGAGPRIEHNVLRDCQANWVGGGLYLNSAAGAKVRYNSFIRNSFYSTFGDGGGMAIEGGQATVEHNRFIDNRATYRGGGLSAYDATVTLRENLFSGNQSGRDGGGVSIFFGSDVMVQYNTLSGNSADSGGGGLSVTSNSRAVIFDNVIDSNHTPSYGGGIYVSGADSLFIQGNDILDNTGDWYGGGVYVDTGLWLYTADNLIAGNFSLTGGGLYLKSRGQSLRRNVFYRNEGVLGGNAAVIQADSVEFLATTFVDNNRQVGHAPALLLLGQNLTLRNCIVAGHSDSSFLELFGTVEIISSCFYNFNYTDFSGAVPPDTAVGTIDSTNANGDSCDAFGNIWVHPGLCDPYVGNLHPAATSHVLGAAMGGGDLGALPVNCALPVIKGDVNASGSITAGDVIYMVNFVFKAGVDPLPRLANGDVTCDGGISSADVIYLVNLVFKGGPVPACW